jgi:hypothetical protein
MNWAPSAIREGIRDKLKPGLKEKKRKKKSLSFFMTQSLVAGLDPLFNCLAKKRQGCVQSFRVEIYQIVIRTVLLPVSQTPFNQFLAGYL